MVLLSGFCTLLQCLCSSRQLMACQASRQSSILTSFCWKIIWQYSCDTIKLQFALQLEICFNFDHLLCVQYLFQTHQHIYVAKLSPFIIFPNTTMARYRDVSNHTPGGGVDNGFCYIKNLCRHIQGLNLTNKL